MFVFECIRFEETFFESKTFLTFFKFFYAVWLFQTQFHVKRLFFESLNEKYRKHITLPLQINF